MVKDSGSDILTTTHEIVKEIICEIVVFNIEEPIFKVFWVA